MPTRSRFSAPLPRSSSASNNALISLSAPESGEGAVRLLPTMIEHSRSTPFDERAQSNRIGLAYGGPKKTEKQPHAVVGRTPGRVDRSARLLLWIELNALRKSRPGRKFFGCFLRQCHARSTAPPQLAENQHADSALNNFQYRFSTMNREGRRIPNPKHPMTRRSLLRARKCLNPKKCFHELIRRNRSVV